MSALVLRDYQIQGLEDIRAAYRERWRAVLFVMPTGAGKTATATKLAQLAAAKGTRTLFTAHRRELVQQLSGALTMWGVDHGVIAPWSKETNDIVQVASVGTLARRLKLDRKGRYKFDLIVTDEAHHLAPGTQWHQVLKHNPDAKYLGITATPARLDGKPLGVKHGGVFDALVLGPSILDLIDQGYLCPPVVYAPKSAPDLDGVRVSHGDYNIGQLAAAMDRGAITGDAVEHYRKHAHQIPAIVFCVTIAHAEHVAEQFKTAGYSASVLTGKTPDRQRERMIDDLGRGRLNLLVSVNTVSEGTDIPTVGAAILLRPTASYSLFMQQCGRALRTAPGKERAIILDHAGNVLRHSLPTEEVEWTLDAKPRRKRGQAENPVKQCDACFAINPANARKCTECGEPFGSGEIEDRTPDTVAGELDEIDAVAEARRKREEVRQAKTKEELEAIAARRGYKKGWAWHEWNRKNRWRGNAANG